MKALYIALSILLVLSLLPEARAENDAEIREVSLVELIVQPQAMHGKRVIVSGFHYMGMEEDALYLTKDDARIGNRANSIAVGDYVGNQVIPDRSFVRVVGVFRAGPGGHMGLWSGEITDISSIMEIPMRPLDRNRAGVITSRPEPPPELSGTDDAARGISQQAEGPQKDAPFRDRPYTVEALKLEYGTFLKVKALRSEEKDLSVGAVGYFKRVGTSQVLLPEWVQKIKETSDSNAGTVPDGAGSPVEYLLVLNPKGKAEAVLCLLSQYDIVSVYTRLWDCGGGLYQIDGDMDHQTHLANAELYRRMRECARKSRVEAELLQPEGQ